MELGAWEYGEIGRSLTKSRPGCFYDIVAKNHYIFFAYSTVVSAILIMASAYLHYSYKCLSKNKVPPLFLSAVEVEKRSGDGSR